jgi:hypothetical protein
MDMIDIGQKGEGPVNQARGKCESHVILLGKSESQTCMRENDFKMGKEEIYYMFFF